MIQRVAVILGIVLCYCGYLRTVGRFCKQYLRISPVREKQFMVLLLARDALRWILPGRCEAVPNILFSLGNHVVLIGAVLRLFLGDTGKKVLTASILTTVTTLTENFGMALFSCLILFWKHIWKQIPAPLIEKKEEAVLLLVVLLAGAMAVYWLSRRQFSFLAAGKGELALPLLAVTLLVDVANWGASHGILIRSGGNLGLYYDQIFSYMEFLVLTVLSMSAAGFYLFGIDRIYLEQRKSAQYHARIAAYQMLQEQYGQSERLRHDMKNHVIALSGLLEHREWKKLDEYLNSMKESAGLDRKEEITGNKVVDALLVQKRQTTEKEKIRWSCDVQISPKCGIDEFDLCILFGNVLDNALEACERMEHGQAVDHAERFVAVTAKTVRKCFLMEISNSASRTEESRIRQIVGTADHREQRRFGIGLLNVRDVVERYHGVMRMEFEEGVFTISILIPLVDDSLQ